MKQKAFRVSGVAVAIAALLIPGFVVAPVHAAPNLQEVRMKVMDLEGKAEAANERYNNARNKLGGIQRELDTLKAKVKRERKELRQIMGSVDDLARATYTSGGIDTSLQVLLAENPTQFLSQAAALDQIQKGQASAIRGSQTIRLRLVQTEAAVMDKEGAAKKVRSQMGEAKTDANDRYREAKAVLANLEVKERRRIAAMAASERAAALAAARAAKAGLSAATGSSGGGFSGSGKISRVIQYALSQVGKRYVAGASGPSTYDCSGLTMQACTDRHCHCQPNASGSG